MYSIIVLVSLQPSQAMWMWLGMSDIKQEGTFVWNSSNAPLNYTNWNDGEPNGGTEENCGSFWGTGPHWNDHNCDSQVDVLCEQILVG